MKPCLRERHCWEPIARFPWRTNALAELTQQPRRSRITGAADFIGPNLLEVLLHHGRHVTALDNFMTGCRENLEQVLTPVSAAAWANVHFIAGDIRCLATCNEADCARR